MTLSQKEGGRGNSEVYTVSNVRFFLFRKEKKLKKQKMFIYMIVIILIGIFY